MDEVADSPLAVLGAPMAIEADPSASGGLLATYPAAAVGLEGDPVAITITLGDVVTFPYQADAAGHSTVSETTTRPTTNLEPIIAPG